MVMNSDTLAEDARIGAPGTIVTPWRAGALLVAAMGVLVLLFPLGLAGDYVNHLARNAVEARIWFDEALQRNYTVEFAIIPDLAMDMVVPWLSHLTGIYAAGAAMAWAAYVLPPLGGLLIARTLRGRVSFVALLGFLAMFNENMQWGFVNFTLSTGLALVGLAVWMRVSLAWWHSACFAAFGFVLAFCHALGFLLFGFLVLMWEIGSFAAGHRGTLLAFLRRLTTRAALAMAPGLAVVALATGQGQELVHAAWLDFSLQQKISSLWSGSLFFNVALAKLVTIIIMTGCWLGLRNGVLRIEPRMAWVCGGLLVLIVAMPTSILGIWGLHFRYPAVLVILLASSIEFAPGNARLARNAGIAMSGILAVVLVNGALNTIRIDAHAAAHREIVAAVPGGARVLPARHERTNVLLTLHAAGIAVIERSAFVPNLFTNTSPVGVRPEMRALHMPQAWPLLDYELAASMDLDLPETENGFWSPRYFFGWPRHWDYVLYFRSGEEQALDLPQLCLEAETAGAVLYRVAADGCAVTAPRTP